MKNKILIPALIILALGVFFSFRYGGDRPTSQEEQKTILQTVMAIIEHGHYSPRPVNDSFSHAVFDRTIENLDFEKKFFLKSDYERLKEQYRNDIDDEIRENKLTFFNDVNDLFIKRVKEAKSYYPVLLDKPFHFQQEDSLQMDGEKLDFVATKSELKHRWRKYLKYKVLTKYLELKEAEEKKAKDSAGYKPRGFAALEKEARESVKKIQDRYFERLEKLNDNDRFSLFMNSITAAEDPHTDYFPPKIKKRFDEMMSGSFIGIGAALQQLENGQIKVTEIITGSPSWKQGRLKAEDIILKVAQGDDIPVDVEGMDLEEVVKIIRGKKGTEVQLTVKHSDGTIEVIPIIRGKVELEDVFARSAIIKDEGKRIGYIYLPEFYADFNGISGRRSGKDVAIEVKKLKAENVDAIILDLRNNGGGSLADVVDMAGIFVGPGPVVQVRTSNGKTITLNNKSEAPIYTGPLAIMVNGGSASASEIMAAAMQDYGRAVIIGSKTFGKGTVQNLVPLDQFVNNSVKQQIIAAFNKAKGDEEGEYDGIGSLKLTIQKFYRINGGSTQLKGVTPDIRLPDTYDYLDQGESKNESALPWDKIDPVAYTPWRFPPPLDKLRKRSAERVAGSEVFKIVAATGKRIKEQHDHNFVPLEIDAFIAKKEESKALSDRIKRLDSLGAHLNVVNLQADLADVNVDSASREKNQKWLEALEKDAYIYETTNVLEDWLQLIGDEKLTKTPTGE